MYLFVKKRKDKVLSDHAMKAWRGNSGIDPLILIFSSMAGCEWLTWTPSAVSPGMNPGTNWLADWVGPRTGLEALWKRKFSCILWNSNPEWSCPSFFVSFSLSLYLPLFLRVTEGLVIFVQRVIYRATFSQKSHSVSSGCPVVTNTAADYLKIDNDQVGVYETCIHKAFHLICH
jgi:hypothetical protein